MALGKTADLLIKIGADGKQAVSEMQKVKGSVGDLSNSLRSGNVLGFSNSIKQMAGSMGTGKLAAIGMAAGVVALGAAATATVGYLFELTKQAADYGSEIYDATVVTGFSAETLSALRVQGEMAGVEFDKLTQGIFKFQLAAGKATEENKKAQEALAFFGLTGKQVSNDLEGSFAKVVARLNEMAPGVEKNSKAAAIFGNRDAKAMLKVIEQINGNVPKTVEEMKRLGITISGSAAKASDEFADSLVLLGAQFEGVKRTIGFAFMPVFREALGEISRWFADNSTNVQVWAARSADAFRTVLRGLQTLVQFIIDNPVLVGAILGGAAGSRFGPWGVAIGASSGAAVFATIAEGSKPEASNKKIEQLIRSGMSKEAIKALYESAYPDNEAVKGFVEGILKYNYDRIKKETDDAAKVAAGAAIATSAGGDADAAKKKAEKDRADKVRVLKADIDIIQERMKKIISDLDKELEDKFPSILPSPGLIADQTDAALKALDEAWFKTVVKRGEIKALLLEGAETPKEKEAIEKEYIAESSRLFEDYWQRRLDIQKKGNEQIFKSAQITDKKYLDEIKRSAESQLTFLEGLRDSKFYTEEEYLNAKLAINNSLIRAELDYYQLIASAANTSVEDRRDAIEKIKDLNAKLVTNEIETQNAIDNATRKPKAETPGFLDGILGALGQSSMIDEANNKLQALKVVGELVGQTFAQMAQGLGKFVEQWVLTGEVGPKAMRKLTASILAGLAAQAAVEALMELGRGFANLAKFYTTGLPSYAAAATLNFQAAAVFGAIAGVAAVAGRAIAGDSFKNESSRATTGERASQRNTAGQGQAFSSQGNQTINATQSGVSLMPTAEIVIRDASGMFSQLFEAEIRNNSRVRRLIIDTANS